jgi:hypothetical protein
MSAIDRYRSANRKDRQGSINTRGGKAAAKKPSSNWKWASGKNYVLIPDQSGKQKGQRDGLATN